MKIEVHVCNRKEQVGMNLIAENMKRTLGSGTQVFVFYNIGIFDFNELVGELAAIGVEAQITKNKYNHHGWADVTSPKKTKICIMEADPETRWEKLIGGIGKIDGFHIYGEVRLFAATEFPKIFDECHHLWKRTFIYMDKPMHGAFAYAFFFCLRERGDKRWKINMEMKYHYSPMKDNELLGNLDFCRKCQQGRDKEEDSFGSLLFVDECISSKDIYKKMTGYSMTPCARLVRKSLSHDDYDVYINKNCTYYTELFMKECSETENKERKQ